MVVLDGKERLASLAIIVQFDNYHGPSILENMPKCVPIPSVLSEWTENNKSLSRQQIPLKLAWAITIHKSQGQTLSKAVIDIGEKELAAGCTFVAFSRMKRITDCLIVAKEYSRYQKIGKCKRLYDRKIEEKRLKLLHQKTQVI